jgi:hypothetical protein
MRWGFLAFLALLLGTFYHRLNHYDEAWLAEQAYWLVRDGRVRSELFCGLNGWEDQLFVFHKGFIYLSALWQKWLGFSLWAGKSFSLVWTVGLGLSVYGYLQQRVEVRYVWLGLLLFVANGLLMEMAFIYRPEPMCVALGFGSFWLLTTGRWAWAGMLAGLATFSHLHGLCFVLAGAGWLVWHRRVGWAVCFGSTAAFIASFYVVDVWLVNGWATLLMQFRNDPSMLHIHSIWDKLKATLHGLKFGRMVFEQGLLVLGIGWASRRTPYSKPGAFRDLWRYGLLLVGAHLLLCRTNALHYALQFVPFICVGVALRVAEWKAMPTSQPDRRLWRVTLGLYLLVGLYQMGAAIYANLTIPGITTLNAHMASLIGQRGAKVLAPLDFFYEQIDHYQLEGIDRHMGGFFRHLHPGDTFSHRRLFQMAEREGFVAVITYDGKGEAAPLHDTRPLSDSLSGFGPYRRVYQDRWNSLYVKE